jgi:hypothetical protein
MHDLEILEKELELKKVIVGKDSLQLDILKRKKEIERIEKNLEIQSEKIKELEQELKALKGE